jgi:prolyl-tRNA synthetase
MRMSHLFSQTLREAPSEAETESHKLLLRAGYIRQLASGVFSAMPLATRSMARIENLIRKEIEAIGGQEIRMPVVHPAELWQESGRWQAVGAEMGRFKDRNNRDLVLGMTHEEVVADLARREVRSYRQMPLLVYQIQTKWRDDPRPRAGLIRVREFTMKDSYSLDTDWEGLDKQYRSHYQAYFNIFRRCGLPVVAVSADSGMMGGKVSHEYMYLTAVGEDTLLVCDACGLSANRQVSRFKKSDAAAEEALSLEKVATPHAKTIDELARFLRITPAKTAKAVFMTALVADGEKTREQFVFAVVRGDMDLNETKLANAIGARELRPATEEEIRKSGSVPGYASPIGLKDVFVVVDDAAAASPNLVAGANDEGYHLLNTNYGRDYTAQIVTDLAVAREGDACEQCGAPLRAVRGVEVGNIFQLGTRFSDAMDCTYLDRDGQKKPIVMGSYGIGVGRLLACIAEEHHDAHGLIWPISVAPYTLHMVVLAGKNKESRVLETALDLYDSLQTGGVDVLLDDREESPGIKFNDADLLGVPLRVTVGERGLLQGKVECKRRDREDREMVDLAALSSWVKLQTAQLYQEIENGICEVPFR